MATSAREDRRPLLIRLERLGLGFWAVFGTLLGVYWVNQVLRGTEFERQAENNRQRSVPITAARGFILDRNGEVLAENEPSFNLLLFRRETRDLDESLRFVASLLGRPLDDVRHRVERDRSYYDFVPIVLQENLTLTEVAAIEARALERPGLVVHTTERRVYKYGTLASHLLGYLGEATAEQQQTRGARTRPGEPIGQKGIEAAYQDLLAGVSGARSYVIDSFGREVSVSALTNPTPGNKLFASIDLRLQRVAEEYFAERVGTAVALDPKTGEILAFVSAPGFDPNLFTRRVSRKEWEGILEDPRRPLNNRVLQNVYSPGSVFKAIVAYGILSHGTRADERVFCPGAAAFYGRSFRCHGAHGNVDLATALQVSCDVYFYTMGKRLGIEAIADAARQFGLGRPTGVDVTGERTGLVPSPEWSETVRKQPWYPGETISVAIGQGPLLTTALQMARAFAALANADGTLPTPHLFHIGENIRSGERFVYRPPAKESVRYGPGVREAIVEGLWRVVNAPGGTAYASRVEGLEICGKTGSVQVVAQKDTKKAHLLPDELKDHAWFAAFAPRRDPRLVVVVFVEHGEHGNTVAAPLAARMFEAYLKPRAPTRPEETAAHGAVIAPSRTGG